MSARMFACPNCGESWPSELANRLTPARCPACRAAARMHVFPALFRTASSGSGPEAAALDGDATCFYHPTKRATAICEGCGAFLCPLCDIELGGRHVCPRCIERGELPEVRKTVIPPHTRLDQIAGSLGLFSLLTVFMCFPALIMGPLAVGCGIASLVRPRGPVPYVRWGAAGGIVAGSVATLLCISWMLFFFNVFTSMP